MEKPSFGTAVPAALSLKRIFWIVLGAHVFLLGFAFLVSPRGGYGTSHVSGAGTGEPPELTTAVPERKFEPTPREITTSAGRAAKARPTPKLVTRRITASGSRPTPLPQPTAVKSAARSSARAKDAGKSKTSK